MEAQQIKSIIERALVSFSGTSTGDGAAGGTTVVCSDLTSQPNYDGQQILIAEGTYAGQVRDINGDTTGGTVTVDPAFGGQIVSGINFYILTGLPAVSEIGAMDAAATSDDMSDITTTSVMAKLRLVLNRLSSDAFTATIQGSARTELDTMLAQLATYIASGGAALSSTVNPGGSTRDNLEQVLEDIADILAGATGIVTFPAGAAAGDGVSLAEVIRYIQETVLGYEGTTSLADKLTSARAGYLDELDFDLDARLGTPAGASLAADLLAIDNFVDELESRLTAARAGYLDNINNVDLANIIRDVAETTGTFSFDETSATEQTMVTVTISARAKIGGIWIDMVNVTQDTTIKVYHKIDGTNLREISSHSWATTDSDGVLIDGFTAYRDIRVTLTCGGGGASSVNVPYAIV